MSPLALIVLGHAYCIGTFSNVTSDGSSDLSFIPNTGMNCAPEYKVVRADYTYIPGVGYYKVYTQAANWDNARATCQSEGGDLAVMHSAAEAIIVGQLISIAQPHNGTEFSDLAHIGFYDRGHEGHFVTVDGQTLAEAGYDKWAPGEPNNGGNNTLGTDDCGSMFVNGDLNDSNCARRYAFVCELPIPA